MRLFPHQNLPTTSPCKGKKNPKKGLNRQKGSEIEIDSIASHYSYQFIVIHYDKSKSSNLLLQMI